MHGFGTIPQIHISTFPQIHISTFVYLQFRAVCMVSMHKFEKRIKDFIYYYI